ncbi:MFS transporter [Oenococcus oeni]|uniref:MFS transporter n=1 Tax=Oenococcus oeni TaxID=1247 RepID=UPI00050FFC0C|nr:MFS transporter [Oenococcus oeni]KGH73877.1 hypothetical protein X280_00600 [Oenococcus oeni IOEB_0502]
MFCIQVGSGFGSFIPAEVLKAFGFQSGATSQSTNAMNGISFSFLWLPIIIYIFSVLLMIVYRKWEMHEPVVIADLEKRHTV